MDWLSATTSVSTQVYASAPVVELSADGDVTVTGTSTDAVTVERRSRTGLQETRYTASEAADLVRVEHTCPRVWSNGVCQAKLAVELVSQQLGAHHVRAPGALLLRIQPANLSPSTHGREFRGCRPSHCSARHGIISQNG